MNNIFKHSAKSGAIGGAILIILYLLIYLVISDMFFSFWISLVYFVILEVVCVIYGIKYRDALGGVLSYGKAFLVSLLIGTVMMGMYAFFEYVLAAFIDEQLLFNYIDTTLAAMENWKDSMTPAQWEEQVTNVINIENNYGVTVVTNFVFKIIFHAINSLILALFIWKRKRS